MEAAGVATAPKISVPKAGIERPPFPFFRAVKESSASLQVGFSVTSAPSVEIGIVASKYSKKQYLGWRRSRLGEAGDMVMAAEDRAVLDSSRSSGLARRVTKARARHQPEVVRELCHDLRGSAAAIMAIVAAAGVEGEMSPAAHARLSQIVDEAQRISGLCRDVLAAPAPSAVVSMDDLARSIATPTTVVGDVAVELRVVPSSVFGNEHELGRALWNLVDNAVRAAGAGGRIRIEVSDDGTQARVAVSDSGPGFGASGAGIAGLGLRIAGRVAAQHGGELVVTQHGDLGGASVVLLLPSAHRIPVAQPS